MESLNEKLNTYKVPIALCLVGLVLLIGGIITSGLFTKPKEYPKESIVEKSSTISQGIKIDLSGAVVTPGVYSLDKDARIEDAIKVGGGFTQNANKEFISKNLNISQKLNDGQKIYIPFEGELALSTSSQVAGASTGKVSINSGSQSELESLPGVGPATASKIISTRPYGSIEELISKKAITKSVFEKIKDQILLN